ncbi:hypothetical protein ACFTZB_04595 [Rhodococcus sp. NPDC057014]|uniref:Rv1733c family protein n=1 Tax=Rhodococcus sp. NPDC057014 TaxID=3346000 RepID=UPI00363A5BF7
MRPQPRAPVPTPIRWWRLRPWNRNHLMRSSDRIEALLVLVAATLVLLAIPFAAAYGTATHTRLEHQTQALRAGTQQVPAVLLEDTHPTPDTSAGTLRAAGAQNTARARWSTPHGDRTGAVPTDTPAKAGQAVTISIGADGNPIGPMSSSGENTIVAVAAALGIWALAAGIVLLPTALTRTLLHRNRLRRWAHEWKELDTPPL